MQERQDNLEEERVTGDNPVGPEPEEDRSRSPLPGTQVPLLQAEPKRPTIVSEHFDTGSNGSTVVGDETFELQALSRLQRIQTWANQNWAFEVSASVLNLAAFACIVVTLIQFQGQATPDWPKIITINSVIAILSTTMKGSMIYVISEGVSQRKWMWFMQPRQLSSLAAFDSASRGPWGSLMFLSTQNSDMVATLGAAITIIALAIDPFAQQLVTYEPCMINSTVLKPTLSRVSWFSPDLAVGGREGRGYLGYQADPLLTRAIYAAMSDPSSGSTNVPSFNCSTGNCTFSAPGGYYTTLSISHSCSNISSSIQDNSGTGAYSENYSLPLDARQNPFIDYEHILDSQAMSNYTDAASIFLSNNATWISFVGILYRSKPIDFEPFAISCQLWPTLKTYNAVVSSGKLEEFEISSEDMERSAPDPTFGQELIGNYPLMKDRFLQDGNWSNCDKGTVEVMSDTGRELQPPSSSPCSFLLGHDLVETTKNEIDPLLSQSIHGDPSALSLGLNAQVTGDIASTVNAASMHLGALLLEGNADVTTADAWVGAIARAMTVYMRDNADRSLPGNALSIGQAQVYKTCVTVRWIWLIFPAILSILTTVFLATIMLLSNRLAENPHWPGLLKSSVLALLLYEPSDGDLLRHPGPVDAVALQSHADQIVAALRRRSYQQPLAIEDDE